MSVTIPTLDLGELGEQIDAQLRDGEPEEETLDAPAPEGDEDTGEPGDNEDDQAESGPEDPPVAEAKDEDFEARYQERFRQDYAERSRRDISAVQSKLDKQIAQYRSKAEETGFDLTEAERYIGALQAELAEYDPEMVSRLTQGRQAHKTQEREKREIARERRGRVEQDRARFYAEKFPEIDPDDPDLRDAFERGDDAAERRRLERLVKLQRLERARQPAPQARAPKSEAPRQAASPERDARGQFVKQRVAETRQREERRGPIPVGNQAGAPDQKVSLDKDTRVRQLSQQLKALGLS